MIFPGHLSAGFLTACGVVALAGPAGLHGPDVATLLIAGTLLGDAPDVDILFYFFTKKTLGPGKLAAHRKYLTHAPLLWLIAGGVITGLSWLLGAGAFWQLTGLLVWLCPWSHFICDSIDCGIMWLWPFSEKQFAIFNAQETLDAQRIPHPQRWQDLFVGYLKNPVAYIEMAVTIVALYTAAHLLTIL